jgi:hypothetical protein
MTNLTGSIVSPASGYLLLFEAKLILLGRGVGVGAKGAKVD